MDGLYWLILFVVLLVIEIATVGLFTIWFAAGSIVAFILDIAGLPLPVQIIAFLAVSVILFVVTRPIAVKYFNKDREKTNAESHIGKNGLVLETINNLEGTGKVDIRGMEWTARAANEKDIYETGTEVSVLKIEGVKLIVKQTENEEGK